MGRQWETFSKPIAAVRSAPPGEHTYVFLTNTPFQSEVLWHVKWWSFWLILSLWVSVDLSPAPTILCRYSRKQAHTEEYLKASFLITFTLLSPPKLGSWDPTLSWNVRDRVSSPEANAAASIFLYLRVWISTSWPCNQREFTSSDVVNFYYQLCMSDFVRY